jgi:hypothetical protein
MDEEGQAVALALHLHAAGGAGHRLKGVAEACHLGRGIGIDVSGEAVGLTLSKVLAGAVDDVAVGRVEIHGADLVVAY